MTHITIFDFLVSYYKTIPAKNTNFNFSPLPWRKQFYDILRYISHITTADPNTARISAKILHLLKSSKIPTFTMPLVLVANRIELKPPVNWNISSLPSPPRYKLFYNVLKSWLFFKTVFSTCHSRAFFLF